MRDRPFLSAGESPRPFSEIRAERDAGDVVHHWRRRKLEEIAALEGAALDELDHAKRKRLLCDAEGIRAMLDEQRRS